MNKTKIKNCDKKKASSEPRGFPHSNALSTLSQNLVSQLKGRLVKAEKLPDGKS